jgi:IPT/TIG domain
MAQRVRMSDMNRMFRERLRLVLSLHLLGMFLIMSATLPPQPLSLHVSAASTTPILLVTDGADTADPYGPYLGEILRAEGMPTFGTADIATLSDALLAGVGVLLLGPTAGLSADQVTIVTNYVRGGGRLIAMRPPASLAPLFGVSPAGSATNEGYITIGPAGLGAGFNATPLQIHAPADDYTLAGATAVASLSSSTAATPFPAVTQAAVGQGQAVLWAYDLARSVLFTRQGSPNVGEHDGDPGFQTTDLYAGYVDLNDVPIPQADEQQRLLAKAISGLSATPLPRLWYFPRNAGAVLVLTGDAHANPTAYFTNELNSIQNFGGHITFYLAQASQPLASDVATWKQAGHGVGIHPYAANFPQSSPCADAGIQQGIADGMAWFQAQFGIPPSPTVRIHNFPWQCWTDAATIEASGGNIGMDTTVFPWGRWLKKADGTWAHGYINGSGLPMRMMDATGHLIPLYQQATTLVDEQLLSGIASTQENLTGAQAAAISQQLIDGSLTGGNYAAITTQFSVDWYSYPNATPWAESTMSYARSKGVPIWSADDWLRFTQARAGTAFGTPSWDGQSLTFTMTVPSGPDAMPLMLPLTSDGGRLTSLTVDGAGVAYQTRTVKGAFNAVASVGAGSHTVIAAYASVMPSVRAITPAKGPTAGGTAVTLSGANFDPLATVTFGGAAATGVAVNADGTAMTAVSPSHTAGAADVVVTNPGNRSLDMPNGFTYVPPPVIASVAPQSGATVGGTSATITGTGFQAGASVTLGGVAATNIAVNAGGTAITLLIPRHAAGVVAVVVTNPDGQGATLPSSFTYETVKALPPARPPATAGGATPPSALPPPRPGGAPTGGMPPNPLPPKR